MIAIEAGQSPDFRVAQGAFAKNGQNPLYRFIGISSPFPAVSQGGAKITPGPGGESPSAPISRTNGLQKAALGDQPRQKLIHVCFRTLADYRCLPGGDIPVDRQEIKDKKFVHFQIGHFLA